MDQFKVGAKVWYSSNKRDRVYKIMEIKGNVAILETTSVNEPKEKDEAYLTDLKPYSPCVTENVIGRPSCVYRPPVKKD